MSQPTSPSQADLPPPSEELRGSGLFAGLDEALLESFVDQLEVRHLEPGDLVFREGDDGREMYAVLAGELEVFKRSKRGREVRVSLLGPHDWFGEMAILDVRPRSATVRAVAPSRLLRLSARDLDALYRRDLKSYALLVMNLARELCRRLRVADGLLANTVASVFDQYAANGKAAER